MDETLSSRSYDDYRSRSRSPSRRGYGNYENNYHDGVDPYYDDSRRGGRYGGGRGRKGTNFRTGRRRGGRYAGPISNSFRRERPGFQVRKYDPPPTNVTPVDRNYDNTIFVGNLSFDCTAEDLRNLFIEVGEVVSADIIYSRGRHKGMGTVEFTDPRMVKDAINQFDGITFMDREIFVKQDRAPPISDKHNSDYNNENDTIVGSGSGRRLEFSSRDSINSTWGVRPSPLQLQSQHGQLDGYEVFIINLPYSTTWQQLKDLFREAGDVIRADVELDYRGYSRGFGNVFFATKEEMYRAIELFNGYELEGRVLEVREGRYNYLLEENNDYNYRDEGRFDNSNGGRRRSRRPRDYYMDEEQRQEREYDVPGSDFLEGMVGGGEKNNFVYCSNLPYATSSSDLYELFESFGKVERAELKFDKTGAPTGIAVVEYVDADTAEICIERLNNYNYGGNDLAVSYAQHNTKLWLFMKKKEKKT